MTVTEAMEQRHSVRSYLDRSIEQDVIAALTAEIEACNTESGMNIQLITGEPNAFKSFLVHYGRFRGVNNYIALVGKESDDLAEQAGYFGQRIVLKAQQLGLNTCWVAASYSRDKCTAKVQEGESLVCVISLGYGTTQGSPHKNKPLDKICAMDDTAPEWFRSGVQAAVLAPTALNRQNFYISQSDGAVRVESKENSYSKLDLGIVKYHFEMGAGKDNFTWA